jgi:Protein of unknown function (DUF2934)
MIRADDVNIAMFHKGTIGAEHELLGSTRLSSLDTQMPRTSSTRTTPPRSTSKKAAEKQNAIVDSSLRPTAPTDTASIAQSAAPNSNTDAEGTRYQRIELGAYYRAEARGFIPGHELDDWLAAERELGERAGEGVIG